MISEFTQQQLAQLRVERVRPLIICDVDEVVVHFTRAFEDYIAAHGLYLDTSSFALNGNIRHHETRQPAADTHVAKLIDDFFVDRTADLHPIDGAVESLHLLARDATVVMLTNLPHHARDKRIHNLRKLGLEFPVVTNSGPKGPAIAHLSALTEGETIFIDDSPNFISSSFDHAPHVHLVHFLHDDRFARHLEPFPFVSLTTGTWKETTPHVQALLR